MRPMLAIRFVLFASAVMSCSILVDPRVADQPGARDASTQDLPLPPDTPSDDRPATDSPGDIQTPPPDGPCSAGLTACGAQCVDTATDVAPCGRCGNPCATGQSCVAGLCVTPCAAPSLVCGGLCTAGLMGALATRRRWWPAAAAVPEIEPEVCVVAPPLPHDPASGLALQAARDFGPDASA